jgi:hypothetical protein
MILLTPARHIIEDPRSPSSRLPLSLLIFHAIPFAFFPAILIATLALPNAIQAGSLRTAHLPTQETLLQQPACVKNGNSKPGPFWLYDAVIEGS